MKNTKIRVISTVFLLALLSGVALDTQASESVYQTPPVRSISGDIEILFETGDLLRSPGLLEKRSHSVLEEVTGEDFRVLVFVSDANENSGTVELGLHPEATGGYDDGRDIYLPPPFPGTFYSGIVLGEEFSEEYYRTFYYPGDLQAAEWPLKLQASQDGYPMEITWDLPELPEYATLSLEDSQGDLLVVMNQGASYEITQGHTLNLVISYFYEGPPLEPEPVIERDSLALVDFYNSTNGDAWHNNDGWKTAPLSEWHGVSVEGNRVTQLNLWVNNLSGPLPESLGDLDALTYLFIGDAGITGQLPATISNLTKLEVIIIWGAPNLEGSISDLFAMLNPAKISEVLINSNFSGELGPWLGDYTMLTNLQLAQNNLSGGLPVEITQLENLDILALRHQPGMSVTWSTGWSAMFQGLRFLRLNDVGMTGQLPPDIGDMSSLVSFHVDFNQDLYGSLPESILNLSLFRLSYEGTGIITYLTNEFKNWFKGIEDFMPGSLTDLPETYSNMPVDGALGQPIPTMLSWYPVFEGDSYRIEVFRDEALQDTVAIFYQYPGSWIRVEDLDFKTDYYWRVSTQLVLESEHWVWYFQGPWSNLNRFTTMMNNEIGPQLLAPAHQAVDVPIPVVLTWEELSGAETYFLEVSPVPGFDTTLTVKSLTGTEFVVTDAMDLIVYFWRVKAESGGSGSGWSETRSFVTELRVPEVPKWTPYDGEDNLGSDVILAWSPSARAKIYDVQLSSDREFNTVDREGTELTETEFPVNGLSLGVTYYWRVRAGNASGYSLWSEPISFSTITGIGLGSEGLPKNFALLQNYPNPFNPASVITYELPENSEVKLEVFDITGRIVTTLVDGVMSAGSYTVAFDGSGLTSGVYLYRLQAGSFVQTRRMLLIK